MRIVYVAEDYQYAMVSYCQFSPDDGSCINIQIELFGRTTVFPDVLWPNLFNLMTDFCIDRSKVTILSHEGKCPSIHVNCWHTLCVIKLQMLVSVVILF